MFDMHNFPWDYEYEYLLGFEPEFIYYSSDDLVSQNKDCPLDMSLKSSFNYKIISFEDSEGKVTKRDPENDLIQFNQKSGYLQVTAQGYDPSQIGTYQF